MKNDQLDRRIRSREIDTSDFYFEVIISVTAVWFSRSEKQTMSAHGLSFVKLLERRRRGNKLSVKLKKAIRGGNRACSAIQTF